jgi:hypothetical protein
MRNIFTTPYTIAAALVLFAAAATFGQETQTVSQTITNATVASVEKSKTSKAITMPSEKVIAPARRAASDNDRWRFESAPYLWLAGIKGDLRVGNNSVHVDQSAGDLLKQLDFAFATRAEFWKRRFGILIDENYVNLGTTGTGPLGVPTDVQPTTNIFEIGPSFELFAAPNKESTDSKPLPPVFSVEVLGGMRYMHNGLGLTRPNFSAEGSTNIVDGFIGNRFKVRPAPPFTLIGKWTVGGGGSDLVWTLSGLADFRFKKSVSIWGGYQVYDIDTDKPGRSVAFNGQMRGLILGATIYK